MRPPSSQARTCSPLMDACSSTTSQWALLPTVTVDFATGIRFVPFASKILTFRLPTDIPLKIGTLSLPKHGTKEGLVLTEVQACSYAEKVEHLWRDICVMR